MLDLRIIKIVEVIEDDDLVSARQQLLDEMRSNETRATCHQNSHGAKLATDDHRWTQILRTASCRAFLRPRNISGLIQTAYNSEVAPVREQIKPV
jgi:hypothetical protein